MDLLKMIKAQKKLDDAILSAKGIEKYPYEEIKLALRVEVAEFAQEWQGFKYWKDNKVVGRLAMLGEFADCLHFALSLFYEDIKEAGASLEDEIMALGYTLKDYVNSKEKYGEISTDANSITKMINQYLEWMHIEWLFEIGISVGFTFEEMEKAYFEKNEINWKRLNSGY